MDLNVTKYAFMDENGNCRCPYCGKEFSVGISGPNKPKYGHWICYNGSNHIHIYDTVCDIKREDWEKAVGFFVEEPSPMTILASRFLDDENSTG